MHHVNDCRNLLLVYSTCSIGLDWIGYPGGVLTSHPCMCACVHEGRTGRGSAWLYIHTPICLSAYTAVPFVEKSSLSSFLPFFIEARKVLHSSLTLISSLYYLLSGPYPSYLWILLLRLSRLKVLFVTQRLRVCFFFLFVVLLGGKYGVPGLSFSFLFRWRADGLGVCLFTCVFPSSAASASWGESM
jgi:hypothetical protein